MLLSKLYCNKPDVFGPIRFRPGLNVVLGEIRLPENSSRSTHNLGKTTLVSVVDFCLCRKRAKDFFLFRHQNIFEDFVFFLEIETLKGNYVTICRSVKDASKLSFMKHDIPDQDYSEENEVRWQHNNVAFEAAKNLLDGLLGLEAIKPWSFRLPVGYALRTQRDFSDVFQLAKFRGSHSEWKPYVAHILGFDASLVQLGYQLVDQIEEQKKTISTLRLELGRAEISLDQIRGLLNIKQSEVEELEQASQRFDFEIRDSQVNREVVEQLDIEIATLNNRRYVLSSAKERILRSLQDELIQFRPAAAKKLFEEAGIVLPNLIIKEFDDLLRFNQEISAERTEYLKTELQECNAELKRIVDQLGKLNRQRSEGLVFLNDMESVSKFREINKQLILAKNELNSLERQRDAFLNIRNYEKTVRELKRQRNDQIDQLQADIDSKGDMHGGRYPEIRSVLAEFSSRILGHKALITSGLNNEGNVEFRAEYLDPTDQPTSEDEGKSYRQALCAAYDLAMVKVMLDEEFIRFIFHDGLLEGLDVRVKMNFIALLRELAERGIQQILTVIDSDLPRTEEGEPFSFDDSEVILRLHDEGSQGRLFRMATW